MWWCTRPGRQGVDCALLIGASFGAEGSKRMMGFRPSALPVPRAHHKSSKSRCAPPRGSRTKTMLLPRDSRRQGPPSATEAIA